MNPSAFGAPVRRTQPIRERGRGFRLLAPACLAAALACAPPDPAGIQIASVRLDPPDATIDIGETVLLTATPVDGEGNVVVGADRPAFSSKAPTVATVNPTSGLVTGLAQGNAPIEVTIGSRTATAAITVLRPAVSLVSVAPGTVSLSRGATSPFAVKTFVSSGGEVTDRAVTWSSSNEQVARVVASGRNATVTAVAPGTASIRATSEGETGEGTVVVDADPAIAFSVASVEFSASRLGANPDAEEVQVSNVGGGTLQGLQSSVQFQAGQPGGWLTAQLSATTALVEPRAPGASVESSQLVPAVLTLRATTGTLAEGTYSATVSVATTSPQVQARSITVRLIVGPGPSIALAPNPVGFDAFVGGVNPTARSVAVTNGGGGALTGLSLGTVTYGPGASGWLGAALSGSTADAFVTLAPVVGSLAAGSYTAIVPVRSSLSGVPAVNLQVTLSVTLGPVMAVSSNSVTFLGAVAGSNPASKSVAVTNSGGGALTGLSLAAIVYGAGASNWLVQSIDTPIAPAVVTLQPNIAGLAAGTYTATVRVNSDVAGVASRTISVTLTVSNLPVIALNRNAVTFQQAAGSSAPVAQTVTVTSGGSAPLSDLSIGGITFSGGPTGWLLASISSSAPPATVTLTIFGSAPPIGSYTASVTVQSSLANVVPAVITVTYNLTSGAVIAVAPTAAFSALINGALPATQVLPVTNSGVGALTGLTVDPVAYAAGQPTGWLQAPTLSSGTAPATLTLVATQAGLAAGSYNATVTLRSPLFGVAAKAIAVTLTVIPSTTIVLSSSAVTLNAPNGGANPSSVNVQVTSGSSVALTGLALGTITYSAGATGWLTRSLSSGTAPATLTLGATVSGLTSGTRTATFQLTSPVATNSPRTITVTLNVPNPIIALSTTSRSFFATQSIGSASSQTVTITNAGGGVLSGLSRSVSSSGWLGTLLNTTTAPATLTLFLSGNVTSLARGNHFATVFISAPGASNSPVAISVSLQLIFTYNTHIAGIVSGSCATSGCHNGTVSPNLLSGDPYTTLVTGTGSLGRRYIFPGSLSSSLVYTRVNSTVSPMPPSGFNAFIRDRFFGWILDFAPRF